MSTARTLPRPGLATGESLTPLPAYQRTTLFALHGLTARSLTVILAVTFGGVGAGMSLGAMLVAQRTPFSAAVGTVSLVAVMPQVR